MPKFWFRGDLYDFEMVASIKRLGKPIPNKFEPAKPDKTHILRWKTEYIDSDKARKEAWLDAVEAEGILAVWIRQGENVGEIPALRGQAGQAQFGIVRAPDPQAGPVSAPKSYRDRIQQTMREPDPNKDPWDE